MSGRPGFAARRTLRTLLTAISRTSVALPGPCARTATCTRAPPARRDRRTRSRPPPRAAPPRRRRRARRTSPDRCTPTRAWVRWSAPWQALRSAWGSIPKEAPLSRTSAPQGSPSARRSGESCTPARWSVRPTTWPPTSSMRPDTSSRLDRTFGSASHARFAVAPLSGSEVCGVLPYPPVHAADPEFAVKTPLCLRAETCPRRPARSHRRQDSAHDDYPQLARCAAQRSLKPVRRGLLPSSRPHHAGRRASPRVEDCASSSCARSPCRLVLIS